MSQHTYETEIELGSRSLFCTVAIDYDYDPGEPMVRYYRDGSGYPGSPATVAAFNVEVTSADIGGESLNRDEILRIGGDRSWAQFLDKLALEYVEREIDNGGWLLDHLFENAVGEEYEYD